MCQKKKRDREEVGKIQLRIRHNLKRVFVDHNKCSGRKKADSLLQEMLNVFLRQRAVSVGGRGPTPLSQSPVAALGETRDGKSCRSTGVGTCGTSMGLTQNALIVWVWNRGGYLCGHALSLQELACVEINFSNPLSLLSSGFLEVLALDPFRNSRCLRMTAAQKLGSAQTYIERLLV